MESRKQSLIEMLHSKFQIAEEEVKIVTAPGRVNLIGGHTDYNMGFVLPGAIDKAIYFAISPREDSLCKLHAADLNDNFEFTVSDLKFSGKGWPNYLMGVVDQLNKRGSKLKGFNCVFGGILFLKTRKQEV